jgi:hypothetical protein
LQRPGDPDCDVSTISPPLPDEVTATDLEQASDNEEDD